MPVTRELSWTYAGVTFGGSTARQITEWTLEGDAYETAYFECEFVTSATTAAAFATELDTVRTAMRTPRGDLVITCGGSTILSLKQSDNTGFDANPEIVKDGDPADTGRSRHFRVRIEFGRPATVSGTAFRRWSTVDVKYEATRQRTVTISGTYTANSTDGTTGSFAQYRAQISSYASTVLSGIDSSAEWERIGEPTVERGETDKIVNFTDVYKEILFNQSRGSLDNEDIVDPVLTISVESTAPGDSIGGGPGIKGGTIFSTGSGGVNTGTQVPGSDIGPSSGSVVRPITITINYECAINKERTTDLKGRWTGTIRPFLISTASSLVGKGFLVVVTDRPVFDVYNNRISAFMQILSYSATLIKQRIKVADSTNYGKALVGVWTSDPFDYYEYPGSAVRLRTYTEEREEITTVSTAAGIVDPLVAGVGSTLSGLKDSQNWTIINRTPAAVVIRQGLGGASNVNIADITVETVAQYRKLKKPSVANAGGVTGGVGT